VLVLLVVTGTLAMAARILATTPRPATVALRLEGHSVGDVRLRAPGGRLLTSGPLAASLPSITTVHTGAATIVYTVDRQLAARQIIATHATSVTLPAKPLSASIDAPVIAQRLRDNCETAALQVLLATTGISVDQLRLQRQLAHSSPPDPQQTPTGPVWGDPDQGFVGRVDGTGPWGGFGVYPRPIAALAARYDRRLRDLTGAPPSDIYSDIVAGHAVLAWAGLQDGPYRSWQTPNGRPIRVNLNEHTIVLTGIHADGTLQVVNVLYGTREVWSPARFERAWNLLGRRALAAT